jgi:hypothetical protein
MKITRLEAGEYKVVANSGTYIVAKLYNDNFQFYGWDIFNNVRSDETAWAWVFDTKREAIEAIAEIEGNQ